MVISCSPVTRSGQVCHVVPMDDVQVIRLWQNVRTYVSACVRNESLLGPDDVHDLAADVLLDVLARLPHVREQERYVWRAARNRVLRTLRERSRKRARMVPLSRAMSIPLPAAPTGCTDEEYQSMVQIRAGLRKADPVTRTVVLGRCRTPARSYAELAVETGLQPSALRMRMTRFVRSMRG